MTDYQKARNALIPLAEAYANEKVGVLGSSASERLTFAWNRAFHDCMSELALEAGLVRRDGR